MNNNNPDPQNNNDLEEFDMLPPGAKKPLSTQDAAIAVVFNFIFVLCVASLVNWLLLFVFQPYIAMVLTITTFGFYSLIGVVFLFSDYSIERLTGVILLGSNVAIFCWLFFT